VKLRWSETAASHLEEIYEFIALHNANAALATVDKLLAAIDRLTAYPQLGRPAHGGKRKLVRKPFVVVYSVDADVVNIEAVFHGKRKYPEN
jgi:toxin ParE1/3/4